MGKKSKKTTSCYKILGVAPDASEKTLKQAYLRLSKEYHPDKQDQENKESIDRATAKFQAIQKAYGEALDNLKSGARGKGRRAQDIEQDSEEEEYDYSQHMYKRQPVQSYFSYLFEESKELEIKQRKVTLEDETDEDDEIERRAQQKTDEFFDLEARYLGVKTPNGPNGLRHSNGKPIGGTRVKEGTNPLKNLQKFRIKQKYEENEHELLAGCGSCNMWFEGIEGYLSHVRSDSHKKKSSSRPKHSTKCNGMLKVTYDNLSLRQRQDTSRWRDLPQESTVPKVPSANPTINDNAEETRSKAVCEYVKNVSSDVDPDLIIKCSASTKHCNARFNSVADYHRHHRRDVKDGEINPNDASQQSNN